ncbi:MAG: peptidoglycan editing factor PgeF [Magnetococcales bacterium]|nr:peptidoglycan editing factor PgeF [Magnetococcales bacterium]
MLLTWNELQTGSRISPFFTVRSGGVSTGPWQSANYGDHVEDNPDHVEKNRRRLMEHLGSTRERLHTVNQVHSATVTILEEGGSVAKQDADAIVTRCRGEVIAVLTADCAPVLMADENRGVIAAVHAGWRGAFAGVVENSINDMIELGARREQIRTWIGPCIQMPAYEVGEEMKERFMQECPLINEGTDSNRFFFSKKSTSALHFDLSLYVQARAIHGGIRSDAVHRNRLCTHEQQDLFFSHRRACQHNAVPCGRQLAGIQRV